MSDALITALAAVMAICGAFYLYVGICVVTYASGGVDRWGVGLGLAAVGCFCTAAFIHVAI